MSDTPQSINGALLRLKRESHGWLVSEMATRACMSVKQIRQLEEGGSSAFYSESVKLTSAKKVGTILGLTPNEVFGVPATESVSAAADVAADSNEDATAQELTSPTRDAGVLEKQAQTPFAAVPMTNADDVAVAHGSSVPTAEQKNKTPLGAIAALFVAALAVAAWMRPEAEPVAVEPPPPLQTLPADTPDGAASAASAEAVAPAVVASSPASQPPAAASAPASKPL